MVLKKSRKPARAAKPMENKDGACPCGCNMPDCKCGCACGCHRAKKIIAKIVILAAVVLLSAHVAKCMVMREFRNHGPHMMEARKDCGCGKEGCEGKKGGWFHRRGPKGEAPAEAK